MESQSHLALLLGYAFFAAMVCGQLFRLVPNEYPSCFSVLVLAVACPLFWGAGISLFMLLTSIAPLVLGVFGGRPNSMSAADASTYRIKSLAAGLWVVQANILLCGSYLGQFPKAYLETVNGTSLRYSSGSFEGLEFGLLMVTICPLMVFQQLLQRMMIQRFEQKDRLQSSLL